MIFTAGNTTTTGSSGPAAAEALIGSTLAEKSNGDKIFTHFFCRQCCATSRWHARTDYATAAKIMRGIKQMHMPTLTLTPARHLAENLCRHRIERNAFGYCKMMGAMRAHNGIFFFKMCTHTDGDWLLTCSQMHFSWHRSCAYIKRKPFLYVGW